jgi:hypothetical protein
MKNINIKELMKREVIEKIIILVASIVLIYLLISLYFTNHFFFNTVINGVNVSLKAHADAEQLIRSYIKDYELQLIEQNGVTERITGQAIGMMYNDNNSIFHVYQMQKPLQWISLLFKNKKYYVEDLYYYNEAYLSNVINNLKCLNQDIIEPRNVSFKYSSGFYEVFEEVHGNKIKG